MTKDNPTEPSKTILVVIEGGMARVVTATGTVTPNVVIVDYDCEGGSPEEISTTNYGDEAYINEPWTTRDDALVDWVDQHVHGEDE